MAPELHKKKKRKIDKPTAQQEQEPAVEGPTGWEALEEPEEQSQAAAEPQQPPAKKLSKHAKKRLKEERERAIHAAELRRLQARGWRCVAWRGDAAGALAAGAVAPRAPPTQRAPTRRAPSPRPAPPPQSEAAPTSEAEFEQLLLSSPSASYVWIKYMALLISLGELDRARATADRALQTISFQEDKERFNVWVAYLNAENAYGTEEGTLALLSRALAHTDARKLYLAALDIFDRTDKSALAEQCLKAMTRKFSGSVEVWLRAVRYRLARGEAEAARRTLDHSLQSLPKFEHVRMISQAALLEFKARLCVGAGDPERGRSLFEGVLRSYPRRLDLWSVYLDQEIAAGDAQRTRALFERATHLALPPKKMKFLFKRYLDYERSHGGPTQVEHVKRRAMEFVEQAMAT
eukprot:scaffold6.g2754.t1